MSRFNTVEYTTAEDIRCAVDAGETVYSESEAYQVIKDSLGQYLIKCEFNGHCIGLTHQDGYTLNGSHFYTKEA